MEYGVVLAWDSSECNVDESESKLLLTLTLISTKNPIDFKEE